MPDLLALREQATAAMCHQLESLDDAEPRWTWWSADQTVGFTRRMQTHEATFHRVDAELAAGGRSARSQATWPPTPSTMPPT